MTERTGLARLIARLTGRWHLERLAAIEEKVGTFGRAQREELAAQHHRLDELAKSVLTRASTDAVEALQHRVEALLHES